jgi:hypothetical protein
MSPRRWLALLLLGVPLVATLLMATAAPHLHLGRDPGFSNQEHDLSLFVAAGTHAPLPDGPPIIALGGVAAVTSVAPSSRPAPCPVRIADPRAPPLA